MYGCLRNYPVSRHSATLLGMDRLELTLGVPAACHQAWSGTILELPSVLVLQILTAVELSRSVSGSHPVRKHPLKITNSMVAFKLTVFSSLGDYFGYGPVGIESRGATGSSPNLVRDLPWAPQRIGSADANSCRTLQVRLGSPSCEGTPPENHQLDG
jgi:hypothetical protein